MSYPAGDTEFVVTPIPGQGGPSEFRQSMAPHPMVRQELPHGPRFGVYNRRLRSLFYEHVDSEQLYWRLRRRVGVSHTGEMATEIRGPEAEAMLDRVFTRDVSRVRVGRCSYQIACFDDGGMIMDGVLLRLAPDRFWYAQGDGEFLVWLRAQAAGFDVEVVDSGVWISQVQGPRSMDVLERAADDGMPEPFKYFDLAEIRIAGQPVVITRTGFTNELGWEFYFRPDIDVEAVGERILAAGEEHDIHTIPAIATNPRRIEAGLLFSGTDFDGSVTPFEAGLGSMVDLDKEDFIGKAALAAGDQRRRTWGMQCPDGVASRGDTLSHDGERSGRVLSTAWSPFLRSGVAIVRLADPELGPGDTVEVECTDGETRQATICELPMYDRDREIPRGIKEDIPEIPSD